MRANEIVGPQETPFDDSRPVAGEGRSLLAPSNR
jgi:hypothetical protein